MEQLAFGLTLKLILEVLVRPDEEAAGAGGRVENGLAETGVGHGDHERDEGAGVLNSPESLCGVSHLAEHSLGDGAQCVDLIL